MSEQLDPLIQNPLANPNYAAELTKGIPSFGQDSVQQYASAFGGYGGAGGGGGFPSVPGVDSSTIAGLPGISGVSTAGANALLPGASSGNWLTNGLSDVGGYLSGGLESIANFGVPEGGGVSSVWGEGGLAGGALGIANLGMGIGNAVQAKKQNQLAKEAFSFKKNAYNQQMALQSQGLNRNIETDYRKRAAMHGTGQLPGYDSFQQYFDKYGYKPESIN